MFTPEQDKFMQNNRYSDVESNRELFPSTPKHAEYVRRRNELKKSGKDVLDMVGHPPLPKEDPVVNLPSLFYEDAEDLWKAVTDFQNINRDKFASQILTDITIQVETDRPFGVVFMSDWHIGGIGTDHEAILRDIDLINSCPHLVAYVGGDPTDNFIPDKLAHAARETLISPDFQWKMFRYAIERLSPSLLAVGRGNHDGWTKRLAGIDGVEAALRGFPVLHTAEDTYIDLIVGEQTYTIYRKHRPIGSSRVNRSAGGKASYNFGKRLFDVGITEHHHVASITWEPRHDQYRYFITTGSYKVEDMHSREWGFTDGGIGTPVMIFYPFRKKMISCVCIEDAIQILDI
jgi:hypothetical protein